MALIDAFDSLIFFPNSNTILGCLCMSVSHVKRQKESAIRLPNRKDSIAGKSRKKQVKYCCFYISSLLVAVADMYCPNCSKLALLHV